MKALTLTQPWATLVAIGAKRIETRSWSTPYRGPLAIHAAKGMPRYAVDAFLCEPFYNETLVPAGYVSSSMLPRGTVIATARLVRLLPTTMSRPALDEIMAAEGIDPERERAFGDYTPGRWVWLLREVVMLPEPIPARGALGLWEWTR